MRVQYTIEYKAGSGTWREFYTYNLGESKNEGQDRLRKLKTEFNRLEFRLMKWIGVEVPDAVIDANATPSPATQGG